MNSFIRNSFHESFLVEIPVRYVEHSRRKSFCWGGDDCAFIGEFLIFSEGFLTSFDAFHEVSLVSLMEIMEILCLLASL